MDNLTITASVIGGVAYVMWVLGYRSGIRAQWRVTKAWKNLCNARGQEIENLKRLLKNTEADCHERRG